MKPNALLVGPMKSGTTWLYEYLVSRGDVCLPQGVKETFFFDRHFDQGSNWYFSHFQQASKSEYLRIVEVAPSYFHAVGAPERIYKKLGSIDVIVTLRDPIKRSWSHYLHLKRKGYTSADLKNAAQEFPEILEASLYAKQLTRWQSCFGVNKVSVLWQEDLATDLDRYAVSFCQLLGLPYLEPQGIARNKSNEATVPPSQLVARIGTRIANRLRKKRFYALVNLAKKMGLKKLFYGRPGRGEIEKISQEDLYWLASQLAEDYSKLPIEFKHPNILSPAHIYNDSKDSSY